MKTSIILLFCLCIGTAIAKDITGILRAIRDPGQTHLFYAHYELTYEDVVAIAAALNGSQITSVLLNKNNMGVRGAVALANVLKYTNITALRLMRNNIGKDGASAIAQVLKDTRITHLDLTENNIGDEGAQALATGLIGSRINVLLLEYNRIGDDGASAIANSLNQTAITHLFLDGNPIGDREKQAIAEVLDGTVVIELYLGDIPKDLKPRIKDSLLRNKLRMEKLRHQYDDFVTIRNGSLQFNIDGLLTKKSDYIEFVRIIGRKKRMYRSVFISESPENHEAEQIADFIDNIETRLSDCFRKSELVLKGFRNFVSMRNGSLEFVIDQAYTKKTDYIEFVEIIGSEKSFYSRGTITEEDYGKKQVREFVDNIETRLEDCLRKSKIVVEGFRNFVAMNNGSLEFVIDHAHTNKSDYIEFAEIIRRNESLYSEQLKKFTAIQIEDFIKNIGSRLRDCLRESKIVVEGFKHFVVAKNGSLGFVIDYAHRNKSDYIEFVKIIGKEKSFHRRGLITEEDHGKRKVRDFVDNIETRLSDCLRISKIVVEGFRNFVAMKNGSLEFVIDHVHTNKADYIEFAGIIGRYKPLYSGQSITKSVAIQVEDFMDNIEKRLEDCFRKSEYVYQQFVEFVVGGENGSLEFGVDKTNPRKYDHLEFTVLITEDKESWINYLSSFGTEKNLSDRVRDFVDNILQRLFVFFAKIH